LIDAVTVVDAPAASVPPVDDRVTHDCVFPAVQLSEAPPVFVTVYAWLDGLNGPPNGPVEVRPPAGVTDRGPATAAALTVTERAFVDEAPLAPVTRTVKLEVPAAVGVPLRTPAADRLRPAGSAPAETDQLYGVVPPVAASDWLYDAPIVPAGSEVVVIVGATAAFTVNVREFDAPPPGVPLNTLTDAVPADAMSAAGIDAVSCVAETNVVVRLAPFQRTTEPATKFEPFTVSVNAAPPAVVVDGERDVTAGTGLLAVTVMGIVVVALCSAWAEPESFVFPNQAAA
jgi:hypothetical protein